jgi:dTMP kinase
MFITFEGIDFAGKTTQVTLLKEYLIGKNYNVITLREPGGTPLAEEIRKFLLDKNNMFNPITELFLFESARSDLVSNVIIPALNSGKIVICDRFCDSTLAYQGYGRALPLDFIEDCNKKASQGLKPKITFFIDVSIDVVMSRGQERANDRFESEKREFIDKVIEGFRTIAKNNPERVHLIDGNKSIEEIHSEITKIVLLNLGKSL